MILFYSDYLEGCHPEILQSLQDTNYCQTPGYGVDDYCEEARNIIREICKTPDVDVHFLVGGTQTNATVISSVLRPYQGVLCADTGHINAHETGAIEHSGHKVLPLLSVDGKVAAPAVDAALESHYSDESQEHIVQPAMLYISQPTEPGTIYSLGEMQALKDVCAKWNIPLFVDGARLGYGLTSDACDMTIADLAHIADVFYIGGTKQGALFGEAVVITNDSLKKDFRYNIKQGGGMLAKGRLLGLQFSTLLRHGLYFDIARNANVQARRIREAFEAIGCKFLVDSPTNQQFPILTRELADRLAPQFGFELWRHIDENHIAVRFCTSWATTPSQVDALVEAVSRNNEK